MQELSDLTQQAMVLLAPVLPYAAAAAKGAGEAAKSAAAKLLAEQGGKVFDWLAAKFRGTPAEATLQQAVAAPNDEDALKMLELAIKMLAKNDQQFRRELETRVREAGVTATQTATVTGDGNTIVQVAGTGNRTTVS